jgi:hypothetical protein
VYRDENLKLFTIPLTSSEDRNCDKRKETSDGSIAPSQKKRLRLSPPFRNPYSKEDSKPKETTGLQVNWDDLLSDSVKSTEFSQEVPSSQTRMISVDPRKNNESDEHPTISEPSHDHNGVDEFTGTLCYVGVASHVRGKFDAKASDSLGVPMKERKTLADGQSLTLEDGTVITPDMVLAPAIPPEVSVSYFYVMFHVLFDIQVIHIYRLSLDFIHRFVPPKAYTIITIISTINSKIDGACTRTRSLD